MGTSRRDFLKKGSLVALIAGVPAGLAARVAASEAAAPSVALGLTKAAFLAQLNTNFLINEGSTKVKVKLVEVTDLPRRGAGSQKEAFSLMFRGAEATALKQNTYLIEHEKLGLFSFLVVPVMRRKNGVANYEAIINRLHP
ncbi:MAG: DUF6916 family protein [Pyrinomonadaceae bacterium]